MFLEDLVAFSNNRKTTRKKTA